MVIIFYLFFLNYYQRIDYFTKFDEQVLQEVAQFLPPEERTKMLDLVQRASRESSRRLRRASCPDPAQIRESRQLYTPRYYN